jgi:hypothetical protein
LSGSESADNSGRVVYPDSVFRPVSVKSPDKKTTGFQINEIPSFYVKLPSNYYSKNLFIA